MIRKSSAAFHITFKLFSESLYAARLFLTAALYEPIMRILMDDEWYRWTRKWLFRLLFACFIVGAACLS